MQRLSDEFTPRRHRFVPDRLTKGDTCEICGEVDAFGGLHAAAEPVDEPAESRLLACSDCGHVRHVRRCDAAVVRFPGSVPCGCRGEA